MKSHVLALVVGSLAACRATPHAAPPVEPKPVTASSTPIEQPSTEVSAPIVDPEVAAAVTIDGDVLDEEPLPSPSAVPSDQRARTHFTAGVEAFEAGDFARAVAELSAADAISPSARIRFNVARARERLGDLAGARQEYLLVIARADADKALRDASLDLIERIEAVMQGASPQLLQPVRNH